MRLLVTWLKKAGISPLLTLQPGGTRLGERIRELLLNPDNRELTPRTELLLYEADRAQHADEVLRPALEKGRVVICDRFADSSTVYQGLCRGLGVPWVEKLNAFATGGLKPDLTLLLDIPERDGRKRIQKRLEEDLALSGPGRRVKLDRLEREGLEFHRKVRRGFLQLARKHPSRIKVIKATDSETDVADAVQKLVLPRLKRRSLWRKS